MLNFILGAIIMYLAIGGVFLTIIATHEPESDKERNGFISSISKTTMFIVFWAYFAIQEMLAMYREQNKV